VQCRSAAHQRGCGREERAAEDGVGGETAPDVFETVDHLEIGVRGDRSAVQRPHRGPDDETGDDILLEKRPEHADLVSPDVTSAAQHEGDPGAM
jgi:hypothetical protein